MLATRGRVNKYATGWLSRARVETVTFQRVAAFCFAVQEFRYGRISIPVMLFAFAFVGKQYYCSFEHCRDRRPCRFPTSDKTNLAAYDFFAGAFAAPLSAFTSTSVALIV